jgi:hypothetical protein
VAAADEGTELPVAELPVALEPLAVAVAEAREEAAEQKSMAAGSTFSTRP